MADFTASMRPRVFPAEDGIAMTIGAGGVGFNEAAGIPRGRRLSRMRARNCSRRFNEAAGIPRGRRTAGKGTAGEDPLLQ